MFQAASAHDPRLIDRLVVPCVLMVLLAVQAAAAETATWQVATVHGIDQFTIQDHTTAADQLTFNAQPNTSYHWYENNGAPDGRLATWNGNVRRGMRTFAMTNVAHGATLDSLKLTFEYSPIYTTINFFITDGQGHYGIFSPASGGVGAATSEVVDLGDGFFRRTLDLTSANTNLTDATSVAVYEHNGFIDQQDQPYTSLNWSVIKQFTIAGMFDYQRSPEGGWEGWGDFFHPVDQQGGDQQLNEYGVALIWGSTVDTGPYGTQSRTIRNLKLDVAGTSYDGVFESGSAASTSGTPSTISGGTTKTVRNWTDDTAGQVVKAEFTLDTGHTMDFTASYVPDGDARVSSLKAQLDPGYQVSQAWDFDTAGYSFAAGESVTISMDVGPGYSVGELQLWHYDGSNWSLVDPDAQGLTFRLQDGLFSVAGVSTFSAYAVAAIPEPGVAAMLVMIGATLLVLRPRPV